MIHEDAAGGTLLLEPDLPRPAGTDRPRSPDHGATAPDVDDHDIADDGTPVPVVARASFRSPSLTLVAAAAIYCGYRSLGVIGSDGGHGTSSTTGRPLLLVEGVALLAAALLLMWPLGHRREHRRTAVVSTAVAVLVAAVVAAVVGGRVPSDALGVAELAFAAVSLGAVVVAERRRAGTVDRVAHRGR